MITSEERPQKRDLRDSKLPVTGYLRTKGQESVYETCACVIHTILLSLILSVISCLRGVHVLREALVFILYSVLLCIIWFNNIGTVYFYYAKLSFFLANLFSLIFTGIHFSEF